MYRIQLSLFFFKGKQLLTSCLSSISWSDFFFSTLQSTLSYGGVNCNIHLALQCIRFLPWLSRPVYQAGQIILYDCPVLSITPSIFALLQIWPVRRPCLFPKHSWKCSREFETGKLLKISQKKTFQWYLSLRTTSKLRKKFLYLPNIYFNFSLCIEKSYYLCTID